jgi:hypothetical protein
MSGRRPLIKGRRPDMTVPRKERANTSLCDACQGLRQSLWGRVAFGQSGFGVALSGAVLE